MTRKEYLLRRKPKENTVVTNNVLRIKKLLGADTVKLPDGEFTIRHKQPVKVGTKAKAKEPKALVPITRVVPKTFPATIIVMRGGVNAYNVIDDMEPSLAGVRVAVYKFSHEATVGVATRLYKRVAKNAK